MCLVGLINIRMKVSPLPGNSEDRHAVVRFNMFSELTPEGSLHSL